MFYLKLFAIALSAVLLNWASASASPDDWLERHSLSGQRIADKIAGYDRLRSKTYKSEFEIQIAMSDLTPDRDIVNYFNVPSRDVFERIRAQLNRALESANNINTEVEMLKCQAGVNTGAGAGVITGSEVERIQFDNFLANLGNRFDVYTLTEGKIGLLIIPTLQSLPNETLNSAYNALNASTNCADAKQRMLELDLSKSISDFLSTVIDSVKESEASAREAENKVAAWKAAIRETRNNLVEKHQSLQTKSDIASNLVWIVGVIGIFGVGAIIVTRFFEKDIAMEWVASGQVIQFVTVTILLSVILMLGLSNVIQEETLGTLLGGIGGYVLSQGVGRAAAHSERNRQIERENQFGAGHSSQAPPPPPPTAPATAPPAENPPS